MVYTFPVSILIFLQIENIQNSLINKSNHFIRLVKSSKFSKVEILLLLLASPSLHFVITRSNLNSKPLSWLVS